MIHGAAVVSKVMSLVPHNTHRPVHPLDLGIALFVVPAIELDGKLPLWWIFPNMGAPVFAGSFSLYIPVFIYRVHFYTVLRACPASAAFTGFLTVLDARSPKSRHWVVVSSSPHLDFLPELLCGLLPVGMSTSYKDNGHIALRSVLQDLTALELPL